MGQETPPPERAVAANITLDFANLRATRVLGRGALGTVFLVTTSEDPHRPFALKVVSTARSSSRDDLTDRVERETTILSLLSHPFLPSLFTPHVLSTPFLTAYALPFFPGGDLNTLRRSQPDHVFSITSLRFYAAEIISALFYLHSQLRIIYRDLKPENVLVQSSGHITLSDFDLSHRIGSDGGNMPNSFVGTEEYISPEVIKGEKHDFGVDFWSFGVLVYEMAFGRTPFKGKDRRETFRNVVEKEVMFGMGREEVLKDLVRNLLAKDPEKRLGRNGAAEEVMSHEFFKGVKWEMIADVHRPPYIPAVDEEEVVSDGGFDIREYFEKARKRKEVEEEEESTATSDTSVSLPEILPLTSVDEVQLKLKRDRSSCNYRKFVGV